MSREAAWDYLQPRIPMGLRVLDVGAGESPFTTWLVETMRCKVTALEVDAERLRRGWQRCGQNFDITVGSIENVEFPKGAFDASIAVYSTQHMIGLEPLAWVRIRQWLKPGGIFLGLSRYQIDAPRYEGDRGDPLFGANEKVIRALATLSLFAVVDMQAYSYLGNMFERVELGDPRANAIGYNLMAVSR